MPTDARQLQSDLERVTAQRDRALDQTESALKLAAEWERRYWKVSRDYSDLVGELAMEAKASL